MRRTANACKDEACGCQATSLDRGEFIKLGVLSAAGRRGGCGRRWRDRSRSPTSTSSCRPTRSSRTEWVESLTERGAPTVYRGAELESSACLSAGFARGDSTLVATAGLALGHF